jgi:hypothetical protein
VDYAWLRKLERMGEETFIPPGLAQRISVSQLLNGVEPPAARRGREPRGGDTYITHVHGGQIGVVGRDADVEGGVNTYDAQGGMFLGDVKAGGDVAGRDMQKTDHGVEPPAAQQPSGGDLRQALANARRTLARLEEQAAGYTSLTIPAHLANELEDARDQVAELEARHHPEL